MCAQRFVLSIIIAGLQHSAVLLWHCFWWNTGTQSSSNNISLWVDMLDTLFLLARLLWYAGRPCSLDFGVYQRKFLWGSSCNDLCVCVTSGMDFITSNPSRSRDKISGDIAYKQIFHSISYRENCLDTIFGDTILICRPWAASCVNTLGAVRGRSSLPQSDANHGWSIDLWESNVGVLTGVCQPGNGWAQPPCTGNTMPIVCLR